MTPVLFLAMLGAQFLDVLTWLAMPRAAEANPLAQNLHTPTAFLLKGLLLLLIVSVAELLHAAPPPRHEIVAAANRALVEVMAVVAIVVGSVGAGSNLAVLVAIR